MLAGALNDVRNKLARPTPPISPEGVPEEWEYADDADFQSQDMDTLKSMFPIIRDVLSDWNLFVNDTKTEFVHFHLADTTEVNSQGKSIRQTNSRNGETTNLWGFYCAVHTTFKGGSFSEMPHLPNIKSAGYKGAKFP